MAATQRTFGFLEKLSTAPGRRHILNVEGLPVEAVLVRHPRARHYRLTVSRGTARITVPRCGTVGEALRFAKSKSAWLARALREERARRERSVGDGGDTVLLDGEKTKISVEQPDGSGATPSLTIGPHRWRLNSYPRDLQRTVTAALWSLAKRTLPARLRELAAQHGCRVGKVTVRNQRSRWGSCASNGNISLNWRLVQMPSAVRDYILLHELMHTRFMNHSGEYWAEVKRVCPEYEHAERWLRENRGTLI